MSLIAWYPLNGNTYDYSSNLFHGTSIGTLNSSTAGKIGSTYIFENNENGVNITGTNFTGLREYTMSAWVNPTGNHNHYNGAIISSGNWNSNCWSFGLSQDNSSIDAAGPWYNKFISYSVPLNTWTHILCTVKNEISYVYVNGSHIGSISVGAPTSSDATNTCIGRETYAGGYFSFNGKINDVRIYNNVLSEKEIKEVAKTKILHFQFSDLQEPTINLPYLTDPSLSASIYWVNSGDIVRTINATDIQKPIIPNINTTNLQILKYQVTVIGSIQVGLGIYPISSSKTYTMSVYYRQNVAGAGAPYLRTGVNNNSLGDFSYNGNTSSSTWPINTWIRIEATATVQSNESGIYLSNYIGGAVGDAVWYFAPQIEEKDHSTPLALGGREAVISDSSEYKNQIVLSNANTPRWTSSSKLGSGCYKFDGINDRIFCTHPANPSDRLTLCAWINPTQYVTSYDRGNIIEKGGAFYLTLSSGGYLEVYWYSTSPEGYHSSLSTIPLNTWTHVASVWDGTHVRLYINGVLDRAISCTTPGSNSSNVINIGAEVTDRFFIGSIDDTRIYATALSAADVLELYKTRASIDNYGNLHSNIEEPYNFLIPEVFCSYANDGVYSPSYSIVDGRMTWHVYPHRYHDGGALVNMFKPNTSYDIKFTYKHDTFYNGNYVTGGFVIHYSDGSADYIISTGGSGNFETGSIVTPSSKTLQRISVYYYTSYEVRIDLMESYIMEHVNTSINNKGISIVNDISEAGITDGIVAWYPLNSNVNDVSRNKYHGTLYGPTQTIGVNNKLAYQFDGSDDYIEIPRLPIYDKSFTISVWAYFNGNERDIILGEYGITGSGNINLERYPNGELRLYWNGSPDIITSVITSIGVWTHIVCTRDKVNNTVKFYVNGGLSHTYNGALTDYNPSSVMYIGRDIRTGETVMNGKLQDLRIYNRPLTIEEVGILYNMTGNSSIKTKFLTDDIYIKGEIKET